jgi:CTP:molybdopterin cytidylyltransferase MocA
MSIVGILPAAGRATRINGLPKYLLPVPDGHLLGVHTARMLDAGARVVLIGAGYHNLGLICQYAPANAESFTANSRTMSETVLAARSLTRGADVLFGMPDTYWTAPDVYQQLARLLSNGVDVAVAVWSMRDDQRGQLGQVAINNITRVQKVVDKDPDCLFPWSWGALAWKPAFWDCIDPMTPHVGYAVQAAIEAGLSVMAVRVEGDYHDCGTFEQYARLCIALTCEGEKIG